MVEERNRRQVTDDDRAEAALYFLLAVALAVVLGVMWFGLAALLVAGLVLTVIAFVLMIGVTTTPRPKNKRKGTGGA